MSSREKPNVVCVRSLVPKLKKSATSRDLVGGEAARGSSIIVPIGMSRSMPHSACTSARIFSRLGAQRLELGHDATRAGS